ncbi:hypothetical protein QBC44DRAFT_373555 [Cladorrhinum sp. PSN332]|nr:hypothetical protein QBC44DRAFT_373555 [Cladorrhinum sp. PSN332]
MTIRQASNKTRARKPRRHDSPDNNYGACGPDHQIQSVKATNIKAASMTRGYPRDRSTRADPASSYQEPARPLWPFLNESEVDDETEPLLRDTRSSQIVRVSTPLEAVPHHQRAVFDNAGTTRRQPVPAPVEPRPELTSFESEYTQFAAPVRRRNLPSSATWLHSSAPGAPVGRVKPELTRFESEYTQFAAPVPLRPRALHSSTAWLQSTTPQPVELEPAVKPMIPERDETVSPVGSLDENDRPIEELRELIISRDNTPSPSPSPRAHSSYCI